jgi:hypothetical protein
MRWVAIAALLFAAAFQAAALPRLEFEKSAEKSAGQVRWCLAGLPDLPADGAVRPHLETGLTTSFVFRLSLRDPSGSRVMGGARVEIRYDVWDEVYHVNRLGIDGVAQQQALGSFEELRAWWRGLRMVVFDAPPGKLAGSGEVRLSIDLVPFSQQERDDAQRWFSESIDRASRTANRGNAEEVTQTVDVPQEKLGRAFNLLMATSIQRRALESWRFSLSRPVEGSS